MAPFAALAGDDVTKMCSAASCPCALPISTLFASAHVPLVFCNSILTSSAECVKPSKPFTVWLNDPKPSSFPAPPSLYGPGVNPVPALLAAAGDVGGNVRTQDVALTLTATEPPSPIR